ncbi:FecR family protein [Parapedobacter luteus]|uniref:FecR family protein n=1 Tax=Parapedobacter luteus TaxID=623280 RepID=A0A1T5A178_9SPHI|nr:FecR domain-containing protein [Parapedobacter luteus]SKB28686.1 FecR family protein [Parapedobacter luteus]
MKLNEYLNKLWRADYPAPQHEEAEASWERFASKAFEKPTKVVSWKTHWKYFSAVAASVMLVIAALQWAINAGAGADFLLVENTDETIRVFTLPDHSVVNLLPGSTLHYAENFQRDRTIKLEGEAYFEVTKDAHAPFSVACNRTITTVLGTSFNIKSLAGGGIEVALYEGSVKMEVEGAEQDWMLSPGELFVYRDAKAEVLPFRSRQRAAPLYVDFEKASLAEIAAYIQQAYGYTVMGESGILEERVTMRIRKNEPLDNIMKTITTIYDVRSNIDTLRKEITLTHER